MIGRSNKQDAANEVAGQGFDGNPAKEPQLPPPQGREQSEMSDSALTPRDAPLAEIVDDLDLGWATEVGSLKSGPIDLAFVEIAAAAFSSCLPYSSGGWDEQTPERKKMCRQGAVAALIAYEEARESISRGVSESQSSRTQGRESVIEYEKIASGIVTELCVLRGQMIGFRENENEWLEKRIARALDHSRRVSTRGELK